MALPLLSIDGIPLEHEEIPASPEELQQVVARAFSDGRLMVPVGGGTRLHLGNGVAGGGIAVRTSALHGIVEYEPDNMTVSALAGTSFAEIQRALYPHRQFIPLDPPRPGSSTVGGLISCNTSGALRLRYGTIRDLLLGVKIVHADGTATKAGGKLVKNVTGYDMCKLYTGALGTLGILTEATFKVMPRPETVTTLILRQESIAEAMETVRMLLRAEIMPEAVEAWNAAAFARVWSGSTDAPWVAMIRIGDVPPAAVWQETQILQVAAARSSAVVARFDTEASERFWSRVADAREEDDSGRGVLVKCSVLHRSVPQTAQRMQDLASRLDALLETYCHAGTGILYGRYVWGGDQPSAAEAIRSGLTALREFCAANGGHMVAEKLTPEAKARFDVWGYDTPALEIMRRIKREFDPKGLLNRGRFVGGI